MNGAVTTGGSFDRRPTGGALALVLGLGAALGCGRGGTPAAQQSPAPVTVGTENIATADSAQLQVGPVISGSLQPKQQATIRAQVSGPVLDTYAEQGQSVKKGAVLARIDATALQDAYLSARETLRSAQSALTVATRNAERARTLAQAGAIAQRDLETAEQAGTNAQAQVADAQARLAAAQKQLSNATVTAPFTGIVSEKQVQAGDVVQPGAALYTVVDPSPLELQATVPAEEVSQLSVGAPVEFSVNGYANRTFTGKVDRINPTADPATRQVRIYATIPNPGNSLVGGLFAQGQVTTESRRALLVPTAAVNEQGVAASVTRINGGKAQPTAVQVGARDEQRNLVEITGGLAAGDTVLLGAAAGLTAGTPVRVMALSDPNGARQQPHAAEAPQAAAQQ